MPAGADPSPRIVCNSGPLIALAGIGQMGLLPRLYSRILIPSVVHQELTSAKRFQSQAHVFSQPWLEVHGLKGPLDALLLSELGRAKQKWLRWRRRCAQKGC